MRSVMPSPSSTWIPKPIHQRCWRSAPTRPATCWRSSGWNWRGVADRDPRHGSATGLLGSATRPRGGTAMSSADVRRTRSGRVLTDEELDALGAEVEEADYDVEVAQGASARSPGDGFRLRRTLCRCASPPRCAPRSRLGPRPRTPPPARSSAKRSAASSRSPEQRPGGGPLRRRPTFCGLYDFCFLYSFCILFETFSVRASTGGNIGWCPRARLEDVAAVGLPVFDVLRVRLAGEDRSERFGGVMPSGGAMGSSRGGV